MLIVGRPIGKIGGPAYDLPIAVAILKATEQIPPTLEVQGSGNHGPDVERRVYLGELSLDGGLRHTNAILPMVSVAFDSGIAEVYVPDTDAAEASLVDGITVYPVKSLADLVCHLRGQKAIAPYERSDGYHLPDPTFDSDMANVRGQEHVKRALEVAAAGGHNVLLAGPPGSGKTLLARTLPSILPRLTNAEALEATRVYSVAGLL